MLLWLLLPHLLEPIIQDGQYPKGESLEELDMEIRRDPHTLLAGR